MSELFFFQNFPISKEVIESIRYVTAANFICQLLPQLYDDKTLMTHSLHGRKPNKFKDGDNLKNGLPASHKAQLISKLKL
jgi:BEN domain